MTQPVPMFSAPGHRDTLWSDVKGRVARSRQIAWEGGTAATHAIEKVSGTAEVRTRSLELHFSWNFGRAEADAQAGKHLRAYRNRPRYGLILPPGTGVEFRIEEKSAYKFLTMEFEPHYVLRVAELQHLVASRSSRRGITTTRSPGGSRKRFTRNARATRGKASFTRKRRSRSWPFMS